MNKSASYYTVGITGLSVILIFLLSSCTVISKNSSVTPGDDNGTATLKKAVYKLWKARSQRDWATVYNMTNKDFRNSVKQEKFVSRGEMKNVSDYDILSIRPIPGTKNEYEVSLRFKIIKMGYPLNPTVSELWLFESGNWVLNKSKMRTNKPF